jgi:putative Mg2+ transporter-C (MgtC) family protein
MGISSMDIELVVRIAVGAFLGGLIGYERDRHRRPVGLRTHLIVAMSAATYMVLSSHFVYWQHYGKDDLVSVDPSRIAASVVSAIGFIAGGAILRNGISVQGLTTAAGLWLVAAIGMCAGAGMFVEGTVVTGLGLLALTYLRRFEDKDDTVLPRHITVIGDDGGVIVAVMAAMKSAGAEVEERRYDRRLDDDKKRVEVTFDVLVPDAVGVRGLIEAIEAISGVRRVQVQHVS